MFRKPIDILVATPGRLLDLFKQKKIRFSDLDAMILDEADRMLDMGFIPDIRRIYNATTKKQQMLMFSATFDNPIQKIAKEFLKDPITIIIKPDISGHKDIKQLAYFADNQSHKQQLLEHFINNDNLTQGIIFTATKKMADRLSDQLYHLDIKTSALHGDMTQGARSKAIKRFKKNEVKILVATDLASRGIDVKNISHVFNYDMPRFPEDYIHRIGRTGRANNKGVAISLISPTDREFLKKIEKFINLKLSIASINGLEPTIISEKEVPKRKGKRRSFKGKNKFFKNQTNAKKRIKGKSSPSKPNH
jgi:superfamily II DNA/RNA helicase